MWSLFYLRTSLLLNLICVTIQIMSSPYSNRPEYEPNTNEVKRYLIFSTMTLLSEGVGDLLKKNYDLDLMAIEALKHDTSERVTKRNIISAERFYSAELPLAIVDMSEHLDKDSVGLPQYSITKIDEFGHKYEFEDVPLFEEEKSHQGLIIAAGRLALIQEAIGFYPKDYPDSHEFWEA